MAKIFRTKNKEDLLSKYIDIFSALYVPEENWLTNKEKEYFIGLVLMNTNKISLLSKHCTNYLENTLNFKNRGVSIYRSKLKKKGWIIQTPTSIELVKAFDFKNGSIPKSLTFNFKLECQKY